MRYLECANCKALVAVDDTTGPMTCLCPNPDMHELTMAGYQTTRENLSASSDKLAKRFNTGKPELSLIPLDVMEEVAKVLTFGKAKYGKDNWRLGHPIDQLLDSLLRHVARIQAGEVRDSESGELHAAHIACNAIFLVFNSLKEEKNGTKKE